MWQAGLKMIPALEGVKYDVFLILPPPVLMVVLGILGIVLWSGMTDECDDFYGANHGLLLGVFHIQVAHRIFPTRHVHPQKAGLAC